MLSKHDIKSLHEQEQHGRLEKAPAVYSARSDAESVVLVPVATQNLNIVTTLGRSNTKAG